MVSTLHVFMQIADDGGEIPLSEADLIPANDGSGARSLPMDVGNATRQHGFKTIFA